MVRGDELSGLHRGTFQKRNEGAARSWPLACGSFAGGRCGDQGHWRTGLGSRALVCGIERLGRLNVLKWNEDDAGSRALAYGIKGAGGDGRPSWNNTLLGDLTLLISQINPSGSIFFTKSTIY